MHPESAPSAFNGISTPIRMTGVLQILQTYSSEDVRANDRLGICQSYLDDLLTITKLTLSDHLDKRKVLTRLREAGFKVNADKSKFCAHETEYLGYILTRDGIKPQSNKVEAILAL